MTKSDSAEDAIWHWNWVRQWKFYNERKKNFNLENMNVTNCKCLRDLFEVIGFGILFNGFGRWGKSIQETSSEKIYFYKETIAHGLIFF